MVFAHVVILVEPFLRNETSPGLSVQKLRAIAGGNTLAGAKRLKDGLRSYGGGCGERLKRLTDPEIRRPIYVQ